MFAETKLCKYCNEEKPIEEFYWSHKAKTKSTMCHSCKLLYKQLQKRRNAQSTGRTFIPRAKWNNEVQERKLNKMLAEQDRRATIEANKQLRKQQIMPAKEGSLLKSFLNEHYPKHVNHNATYLNQYHKDVYLHYHRCISKIKYDLNVVKGRNDVRFKKMLNPSSYADKVKRFKLLVEYSDNTLTRSHLQLLLDNAHQCPYCDVGLNDENKSFDHLDPIDKGGVHGVSNLIICCKQCNINKNRKPFNVFIKELSKEKQTSLLALYNKLKGHTPMLGS